MNVVTMTDSYKFNHWNQYPKGTEKVYSYLESRKGAEFSETVFFGLQYLLDRLDGCVVRWDHIEEASDLAKAHFGRDDMFNRQMWQHIVDKYEGRLPVTIRAVPEGIPVPTGNVLMTVENTDPKCYALTNHLETYLTHVWYSSTVATLSRACKKMMKYYLADTSDSMDGLPFMLHDFGYRGVSSLESAGIGGAGHLVNFLGTDTVRAIEVIVDHYYGDINKIGFSVSATEHSVMTSLGEEGEMDMVDQLLNNYPTGILSVVSDSYDICRFVKKLGSDFKERILARDGVFVVRPDSITPELDTPEKEVVWIADQLWKDFGGTINSKNFKVINPKIKILWGDGIDIKGIDKILYLLQVNKFSADNMAAFGMGGGLLQKINRDTQRFAFKCSSQYRGGQWHDIFKKPSDPSKESKKGRLKLVCDGLSYRTSPIDDPGEDILETVFENGKITKHRKFDEIRENAKL